MIIPVRCVTCGKVLADKWKKYTELVEQDEQKDKQGASGSKDTHPSFAKNPKGKIMDDLGITKICCRRHMLGHVDIDI